MRVEARAIRAGAPWSRDREDRHGPAARARRSARSRTTRDARPALIAGVCGALDAQLEPGDVVLASELRTDPQTLACPDPAILAGVLRRGGMRVHIGPIVSSSGLVFGERRRELAPPGALGRRHGVRVARRRRARAPADDAAGRARHARATSSTARRAPRSPPGARSARCARRARCSRRWAQRARPARGHARRLRAHRAPASRARSRSSSARSSSAAPRSTCASRSSTTRHVVGELERRGAVFVDDVDEVPARRDGDLLRPRRLAGGARARRRARARRDRRDLPAGRQGPRRGAPLRRRGLPDRARRPRGPRGGRGHGRRGARRTRASIASIEEARTLELDATRGRVAVPDADDARRR